MVCDQDSPQKARRNTEEVDPRFARGADEGVRPHTSVGVVHILELGGAVDRERVAVWVGARKESSLRFGGRTKALVPTKIWAERRMDITWLTERIAVGGGIWNSENMGKVAREGITHVIDMQIEFDDTPLGLEHGVEVLWNPTDDDFTAKPAELFRTGVDFA